MGLVRLQGASVTPLGGGRRSETHYAPRCWAGVRVPPPAGLLSASTDPDNPASCGNFSGWSGTPQPRSAVLLSRRVSSPILPNQAREPPLNFQANPGHPLLDLGMSAVVAKAHIRTVTLRKWFPANDALAVSVARLCILREDFMTELRGIEAEIIPQLDQHSDKWRRMYFLRNSIRTFMEIRSTIETLDRHSEFKRILASRPPEERKEFRQLVQQMNAAHQLVKELRNATGGHVSHERTQQALNEMDCDRFGLFEIGPVLKDTHYKFAGELLAGMIVAGVPESQQTAKLESDFKKLGELVFVIHVIDLFFLWYLEARRLLPLKRRA